MYEGQTYEAIMERVLSRVSDSFDKREGSLIFDAAGPLSAELSLLYIALDYMLNCMYVDTAPRENLILLGRERGVLPSKATAAVGIGEFNIDIEIGARFSLEQYNYIVTEKIDTNQYMLTCETPVSEPNAALGTLIPIEYIAGLESAELTSISIPGVDEEDTEVYRARLIESYTYQAFGGNQIEYKQKILYLPGVGAVKVYPVWNENLQPSAFIPPAGTSDWLNSLSNVPTAISAWLSAVYTAGTNKQLTTGGAVKAIILDGEYDSPSEDLLDAVQTAIDPTQNAGEGAGFAPIGHVVNIMPPITQTVNINFGSIDYAEGYDWETVQPYAEAIIDNYLLNLKKPEDYEQFDIQDFNVNADLLNAAIANRVVKNTDIAPGCKAKVSYDKKGLVTGGENLAPDDIPNINISKIEGRAPVVYVDGVPVYGCRFVDMDSCGNVILRENGEGEYILTVLENGEVLIKKRFRKMWM